MGSNQRLVAHLFIAAAVVAFSAPGCGTSPTGPEPPPATCTYSTAPSSADFSAPGGAVTFHVSTTATCTWSARSDVSWINVNVTSGTGPSDVTATAGANESVDARSGQLTIAGQAISARQPGKATVPCEYVITPESQTWGADGGTGRITVQAASECAWTARSTDAWVTVHDASGAGSAVVTYTVGPFDGTDQRRTNILVNDRAISIRQDPPCSYSVDPTSARVHWPGIDGLSITLTTASHCSWTAQLDDPWIELLSASSGQGSTIVRVRIGQFTGKDPRSAPLKLRWPTATAGQNVLITQDGCAYFVQPPNDVVPASGGDRLLDVAISSSISPDSMLGCPWTASTDVTWITFPAGTTGYGDASRLHYTVAPLGANPGRVGHITVGWAVVTVTQNP